MFPFVERTNDLHRCTRWTKLSSSIANPNSRNDECLLLSKVPFSYIYCTFGQNVFCELSQYNYCSQILKWNNTTYIMLRTDPTLYKHLYTKIKAAWWRYFSMWSRGIPHLNISSSSFSIRKNLFESPKAPISVLICLPFYMKR